MRISLLTAVTLGLLVAGCPATPGTDAGPIGIDTSYDAGPCGSDTDCPGSYCNPGSHACCVVASPGYEICGDGIDQNCDRRDVSCGDTDGDHVPACRPGEDPTGGVCDCDDESASVRPAMAGVAGALEACDDIDNNCNGRIDESSACCDGCASLGEDRDRADVCTEDGTCDCSTDTGSLGPCPEGRTCCSTGCVDVSSDPLHCAFCESACTNQADRCTAGVCACGDAPPCDFTGVCTDGMCPPPP